MLLYLPKHFSITLFFLFFSSLSFGQCVAGEVELTINTGGGGFDSEIWINITTGVGGTGTVIWAQGNGTIGDGAGGLTTELVCVTEGIGLYINCYDELGDSWNGATYTVEVNGVVIANNGGTSPTNGATDGGGVVWGNGTELETSELFYSPAPPIPTDVCEDASPIKFSKNPAYSPTSGKAGIAIILVTDNFANEVTFELIDLDGNIMYDETAFPGAPVTLANNTIYTIYDNECFDVNQTANIPDEIELHDSSSDGIFDDGGIQGSGLYVYYYASDGLEVFSNDNDADGTEFITVGTAGFPSFYTNATNKRTNNLDYSTSDFTGLFPPPSSYEYISTGSWSGTGVSNLGTVSKTYFPSHPGLITTLTVPSSIGEFDPSAVGASANNVLTYTYNSVYGVKGPASCNVQTITTDEIDVHARPTINPVHDQLCDGNPYTATINVDLGAYNVSVDEDGGTPFTISGTGGTVSPNTLTGTGVTQVTISNIPSGGNWSLDITDGSGVSCGLTGSNGSCIDVLPIELVDFSGINIGTANQLFWKTITEINNDYFIIEKSIDGDVFTEVGGYINGAGNSTTELDYTKIDRTPYALTYYRLKQIDFDGRFSYSDVIRVINDDLPSSDFDLFPNPTKGEVTIRFNSKAIILAKIMVENPLGEIESIDFLQTKKGVNKKTFNIEHLSTGVYIIHLILNDQTITNKLVKL